MYEEKKKEKQIIANAICGCENKECQTPCQAFTVDSRGIPFFKCKWGGMFMSGHLIKDLQSIYHQRTMEAVNKAMDKYKLEDLGM